MASFPPPRFVELPGLTMAVHEAGPVSGVPVVLCHGWPEIAYSWHRQMPALGAAGYRVLAPDMRGYGRTGGPRGPEAVPLYDIAHLTGDLAHLLDALGLPQAVFVGHDWGGMVAWQMPVWHPQRCLGVIGVNTPYIPPLPRDPVEMLRADHGDAMYMVRFQEPGLPERLLGQDTARSLRFLLRRLPPPAEPAAEHAGKVRRLALLDALVWPESAWPGEALFDAAEQALYVEAFERSGWEGGINWYRNLTRNWELARKRDPHIQVPALMLFAAHDPVLRPELGAAMPAFVPNLEIHTIADCGHWTQAEAPNTLNTLMLGWLGRFFPTSG